MSINLDQVVANAIVTQGLQAGFPAGPGGDVYLHLLSDAPPDFPAYPGTLTKADLPTIAIAPQELGDWRGPYVNDGESMHYRTDPVLYAGINGTPLTVNYFAVTFENLPASKVWATGSFPNPLPFANALALYGISIRFTWPASDVGGEAVVLNG